MPAPPVSNPGGLRAKPRSSTFTLLFYLLGIDKKELKRVPTVLTREQELIEMAAFAHKKGLRGSYRAVLAGCVQSPRTLNSDSVTGCA